MEHHKKVDETTHIRVWKKDHHKLTAVKTNMGFKSLAWVIHGILEEKVKNPASVEAVMKGTVPIVLVGKPLSGKTFFVKNRLLPSLKGSPVLVIDSWDEYNELRNIKHDIYSLNFRDFNELSFLIVIKFY